MKKVLILGPGYSQIVGLLGGFEVETTEQPITRRDISAIRPDLILSFGYRYRVSSDVIAAVAGRALNMHISLLPWNRGADPNFWSWVEGTPKGVTVHWMDAKLDTGPILAQEEVYLDPQDSLAETHSKLQDEICDLLAREWHRISSGEVPSQPQDAFAGTYHNLVDKEPHMHVLENGWDTKCVVLQEYGIRAGLRIVE